MFLWGLPSLPFSLTPLAIGDESYLPENITMAKKETLVVIRYLAQHHSTRSTTHNFLAFIS